MIRLLATLLAVLLRTNHTLAQSVTQPPRPPVELGIGFDKIWTYGYFGEVGLEGFDAAAVSLRGTFPFTPRYAIEGIVSAQRREERFPGSAWSNEVTEVMYAVQVKKGLRATDTKLHGFATFGAAGAIHHRVRPERTVLAPAGTVLVIPRSVDRTVVPPVGALLGGGAQYDFGRRTAFRADAQVAMLLHLPVAVRVSASLTVPFGSYR
jgi:hypothetical protein